MRRQVEIVVPLYNEAAAVRQFHDALMQALQGNSFTPKIIYVNDGSSDGTQEALLEIAAESNDVTVIELSRNFGHQAALTAGLDAASAEAVIMMDGDGQHPPALLPEMLRLYEQGYDIVRTQRMDPKQGRGGLKELASRGYYRALNQLSETEMLPGGADFCLLSRPAADALQQFREFHRFLRGIVSGLGFRTTVVPFTPDDRTAGESKYTWRKMFQLAADGVFSFSLVPLKLGILFGVAFLVVAAAEIGFMIATVLGGRQLVPGWSSLILVTTAGFGAVMILLGFIGIYVGRIFQEVKRRPVYLTRSVVRGGTADRTR